MFFDVDGPLASWIFAPQIESANAHNVKFRMSVHLDH